MLRHHEASSPMPKLSLACLAAVLLPWSAYPQDARPTDVDTPESVVRALYETVTKEPGARFQWDRMRTLFVPGALLLPNLAQTRGVPQQHSVESFVAWIDSSWSRLPPGGDRGFTERETSAQWERFGDVAHVFSTYEKRYMTETRILGRGINSIQLVRRNGRWWIVAMSWDEESAERALPAKYGGAR